MGGGEIYRYKYMKLKFGQGSQGKVRENGIKMVKSEGNLKLINYLVV